MRALSRSRTSSTFKSSLDPRIPPNASLHLDSHNMLQEIHCLEGFTDGTVAALAHEGLEETHKKIEADRKSDQRLLAQATSLAEKRTRFKRVEVALPARACAMMLRGSASPSFQMRPPREEAPGAWLRNTEPPSQKHSRDQPGFFTCLKPRLLKDNLKDRHFSS